VDNLNIKNIFFDDIERLFDNMIESIARENNIDPEILWKKLDKDSYGEVIDEFDQKIIDFYLDNNKFSIKNFFDKHVHNQNIIVSRNSNIFKYFLIYINSCQIIYEKSFKDIEDKSISENLKLCISLYGLIVRKSEQIVTLLIDGYVDAAMIIWRSLYENAIVTITLLKEKNEDLAKKFMNHSLKNSKKKILSYGLNHEELNFPPLPTELTNDLKKEEERIEKLYGKEFIKNEYGWADELIEGNQKASLRELEKRCQLSRYRPYYLMCSEHSHIGFNALNGYKEENSVILPRIIKQNLSLQKLIDPIQFTVSIMYDVNDYFLHTISIDHEYDINIKFLKKISNELIKTFSDTKNDEEE
jgi:Family of unknown function (DUF5677)